MLLNINKSTIEIILGDITDEYTDIIVNAASKSLQGGGGVDFAIHESGGRESMEECREIGWCDVGDAKITTAGNLNAKYVVHAVGPVYLDGQHDESEMLASAYRRSLELALEYDAESISFPAISSGSHAYPPDEAAEVALKATVDFLQTNDGIELVRFVLFEDDVYQSFIDTARALGIR